MSHTLRAGYDFHSRAAPQLRRQAAPAAPPFTGLPSAVVSSRLRARRHDPLRSQRMPDHRSTHARNKSLTLLAVLAGLAVLLGLGLLRPARSEAADARTRPGSASGDTPGNAGRLKVLFLGDDG